MTLEKEHEHRNPWKEYAKSLEKYIEELEAWYVNGGGTAQASQDGGSNPTSPRPPKPTPPQS